MEVMVSYIENLDPVLQALIATLFSWTVTALGAALVFLFRNFNQKLLDGMLGFAAGVMIAASVWSLLVPALEISAELGNDPHWFQVIGGFIAGGVFLAVVDKILPHLHPGFEIDQAEGMKSSLQRSVLLVLAITIHNIPEGLAIGVAFGAVHHGLSAATFGAAVALSIGIAIQNFPEGVAVSVPLRREGYSASKAFFYGQLSGFVEPIAGVIGVLVVIHAQSILPFALSFAAGAMLFVVVEELIPESQLSRNTDLATVMTLLGFGLMMLLDVSLG